MSTGPTAMPTPMEVEEMAIAVDRAGPVNVHMRMARLPGMISALPTPIAARAAISCPASPANAAHTEDAAKTTRPVASTVR